jgi:hypothetical protein
VGLYDAVAGTFQLKSDTGAGPATNTFRYGPTNSTWKPVAGDWDGDSDDPAAGRFFLKNENSAGVADTIFRYGPAGAGWTPIAGDWDGDGDETVGLFNPATGTFYLKNTSGRLGLPLRTGRRGLDAPCGRLGRRRN